MRQAGGGLGAAIRFSGRPIASSAHASLIETSGNDDNDDAVGLQPRYVFSVHDSVWESAGKLWNSVWHMVLFMALNE